jgi:Fe-S cluster assembly scaffold protein SufB
MAQALLLSESAEFDSKPELEIFADDVVCGHGSTSGQIDDPFPGTVVACNILLSETAEFDSKPELEIFADDVVCGHGSTSGQIDDELLFYLEARGIPEDQARALLIQAFVGEALERIEHEGLRDALARATAEWLGVAFD